MPLLETSLVVCLVSILMLICSVCLEYFIYNLYRWLKIVYLIQRNVFLCEIHYMFVGHVVCYHFVSIKGYLCRDILLMDECGDKG